MDGLGCSDPRRALQLVAEALSIIDLEYLGRPGYKAQFYKHGCELALNLFDTRLARFYAWKCYEAICLDEGPQSRRAQQMQELQQKALRFDSDPEALRRAV